MKKLIIIILFALVLSGCSKEPNINKVDSENSNQIYLGDGYQKNEMVGGVSFYTLKGDCDNSNINPIKEYYPSIQMVSDYGYTFGEQNTLLFPNQYYCFGDGYMYGVARGVEFCDSLNYATDSSFFDTIDFENFSDFSTTDKEFSVNKDKNGLSLISNVYFSVREQEYLGKLLIVENENGQNIFIVGSYKDHFTEEQLTDLVLNVDFNTESSANIKQSQTYTISNFGKSITLNMPYPFICEDIGYSEIAYGKEWYSYNPYFNYSMIYRSFKTIEGASLDDIASMFSMYGYEKEDNYGIFTKYKVLGTTDFCDEYEDSYIYIAQDDGYSYVFVLSCNNDNVEYPILLESALSTATFGESIHEQPGNADLYMSNYRIAVKGEDVNSVVNDYQEASDNTTIINPSDTEQSTETTTETTTTEFQSLEDEWK